MNLLLDSNKSDHFSVQCSMNSGLPINWSIFSFRFSADGRLSAKNALTASTFGGNPVRSIEIRRRNSASVQVPEGRIFILRNFSLISLSM